ncbi:75k gamma secalin [Purpureocillium lilacinum]|uniref:75k gamma secalin n=1 Tax=Purpureocillium lilacinum TaxID=33203 RepID=A0A2U3E536_PURLI|nr:75k gamma secalin [Purpureocillium lilacinum]
MEYRGSLPSGQAAAFSGQPQDAHLYAPQAGYHHQQHQHQHQQHVHPSQQQSPQQSHHHVQQQQHHQGLYASNGAGAAAMPGQFYGGGQPMQQPQQPQPQHHHQQQQFLNHHPNQQYPMSPQQPQHHQHQQQQQQRQQQFDQQRQQQMAARYGVGLNGYQVFDAGGATFAPMEMQQQYPKQQMIAPQQQMQHQRMQMSQQMSQVAHHRHQTSSPFMPSPIMGMSQQHLQSPVSRPLSGPQLQQQQQQQQQQQMHAQQQMFGSPVASPQIHHQASPQPRPSSTRPLHQQPPRPRQPSTPRAQYQSPTPQPQIPQQTPPPPPPQQLQQQQQPPTPQPISQAQTPVPEPQPPIPELEQTIPQEPLPPPPPAQEEIHFVNPLDILQAPPPPLPPPIPMGSAQSSSSKTPAPAAPEQSAPEQPKQNDTIQDTIHVKPPIPGTIKPSPVQTPTTAKPRPRKETKVEPPRIKSSPHSSVSNSPALSTRSPSITKKSPAIPPKPRPVNTGPIMVAIAEECLDKARASVHDVAMSLHPKRVDEYQKLIATSLSCLEATLQNSRLSPREEARLRLRYAATMQEETDNIMEAETALGKGITICDKHRLIDLKYCMQYLMLKVLFQRNNKAALKAVDGDISDCEAFKHVQWYYAFRLLKATFYLEMGSASDAGALENIRSLQNIANTRGDNALSVLSSVLEGLTLLKTSKDGGIERVQACIAQAAKFQFDPTVKIMQLDMLTLLLDFASSLHRQSPDTTAQKLRLLQKRLDECEDWHNVKSEFLVPIKKQPTNARTVSEDTAAIVRAGDGDSAFDYLVMSFMTKMELRSLIFTFSGLADLHKPSSQGRRSTEFWREGLKILDTWDSSTAGIPYGAPVPLSIAVRQRTWRVEAQAYINVLLGLMAASHCQWDTVKQILAKLGTLITPTTQPTVRLLSVYLSGVYRQGTGDLKGALDVFVDSRFAVPRGSSAIKAGHQEIALLAGLNRLWIMQHPSCRNDQETQDLIEQLQPFCSDHWNIDLRTAWHNVVAALETDPPQQLNQQKQHIHAAMAGSKITNNILGAAVTLCIMRSRFFENVIGEQALKSARAASKQAQRSGNILWQSVADGMLAHSYEVQGQRDESRREWEKATQEAKDAFAGS